MTRWVTDVMVEVAVADTGLGLTLSRQFIEPHGGRLPVESEPGTGSTFRFTLPPHQQG
jgi:signal transduction histidine kinase